MSRAAALAARKKQQKGERTDKRGYEDMKRELGIDKTVEKGMKGDTVLCVGCGATTMGPKTTCSCSSRRPPPGDATYKSEDRDTLRALAEAQFARHKLKQAEKKKENLNTQEAKAGMRDKARNAKDVFDPNEELEDLDDLDNETYSAIDFAVGKLGMSLDKNCVVSVSDAAGLGVAAGWVIDQVDDVSIPNHEDSYGANAKKEVQKAVMKAFKSDKPAKIRFRCPEGEAIYCYKCDKFLPAGDFEEEQASKPPGKRMCGNCEMEADF